jgi:hypothetical protein
MPECQNCGAFVTPAYARVFTPAGVDQPRACPSCEDVVRDGAEVRPSRNG